MSVSEAVGMALIAFGPAFFLFVMTIGPDAVRVIVLAASAFCWLLSLLVSSLLWFAVVPLREWLAFGMVFSVLFQEAFRYGWCRVLGMAREGLRRIADTRSVDSNRHAFAYVSGLGFGLTSGAFAVMNVIADASGPGTVGLKSGSDAFLMTSALTACCAILLHTFWGVIFFDAVERRRRGRLAWVVLSHLAFSSLTLLNSRRLHFVSIPLICVILAVNAAIAYRTVGGTVNTLKKGFTLNANIF